MFGGRSAQGSIKGRTMLKFFAENKDAIASMSGFIAAILPALLALFALYQIVLQRRNDDLKTEKEQIRSLVNDRIILMGESAYEVLAQAYILIYKFKKDRPNIPKAYYEAIEETKKHIDEKKGILIEARRKDRYSLLGLEEGFYVIARVSDWVKELNENIDFALVLLNDANKIRELIDENILRIKVYGKLPRKISIFKIWYLSNKIINRREFYWKNREIKDGKLLNIRRLCLKIKYIENKK
jgi:hypothetical protein